MIVLLQNDLEALRKAADKAKGLPAELEAARGAAEEQRRAAEVAQAEARVLRDRCAAQGQAISQQQDKENQWKVRRGKVRGGAG